MKEPQTPLVLARLVVRVVDFVISFSCAAETNQEVLLESSEQAIIQDAV